MSNQKRLALSEMTDVQLEALRQRIEGLRFAPAKYKADRLREINLEIKRRLAEAGAVCEK